jgi:hypothetical protein
MTKFFIAANVWLLLATVTLLGRTFERSEPTQYSFFHAGAWFSPGLTI